MLPNQPRHLIAPTRKTHHLGPSRRVLIANFDRPQRPTRAQTVGDEAHPNPLEHAIFTYTFTAVVQNGGGDEFGSSVRVILFQSLSHPNPMLTVSRVHFEEELKLGSSEKKVGPHIVGCSL